MKKYLLSIIVVLMALVFVPTVKADSKVPVYMITKVGCPACESAKEYFTQLDKENPGLFQLITLEVFDSNWNIQNTDLETMFQGIYEIIGANANEAATPTIVIGDYSTIGLPQDTSQVYNAIISFRDEKKEDAVKKLAEEKNIDLNSINSSQESTDNNKTNNDVLIIIGIFVVLIGGFVGLVYAGKK